MQDPDRTPPNSTQNPNDSNLPALPNSLNFLTNTVHPHSSHSTSPPIIPFFMPSLPSVDWSRFLGSHIPPSPLPMSTPSAHFTIFPSNDKSQSQSNPPASSQSLSPEPCTEDSHDTGTQCWFMIHEDGLSDMDVIALWCLELNNYKAWRSGHPSNKAVSEKVATYLKKIGHPRREPREVKKKIKKYEEWFKTAHALKNGTGQGN
ncbi:hypothetical protein DFH28DRAFT_1193017 [Melampsora americana]|nr:hypothetical protein DFH28DRAFT_1193017 [Melampsora americana]